MVKLGSIAHQPWEIPDYFCTFTYCSSHWQLTSITPFSMEQNLHQHQHTMPLLSPHISVMMSPDRRCDVCYVTTMITGSNCNTSRAWVSQPLASILAWENRTRRLGLETETWTVPAVDGMIWKIKTFCSAVPPRVTVPVLGPDNCSWRLGKCWRVPQIKNL